MRRFALAFLALAFAACGGVKVLDRDEYEGARQPRPDRIIVYDFAATPSDLPDFTEERQKFADRDAKQTEKELEVGRKLGAEVAKELVKRIEKMGLPAVRAKGQREAEVDDIALIGAFTSVDKGSAVERVVIGFGMGSAELNSHVAGYQMTANGWRRLGSGDTGTKDNRMVGLVVPVIVTLATANPIGLVVGGAVKAEGEVSGRSTIEGAAKGTAEAIAKVLKPKFQEQGWIEAD